MAGSSLAGIAFDLLRGAGQPLAADALAGRVFGLPSPSGGRWSQILEAVLAADDRFVRTADGWELCPAPPDAADDTVVAIAISSTGARPDRQRIVRLSAVRRGPDGVVSRLDTPINPRRRLARYLSAAVRVTQEDADSAPAFAEVVDSLRELVGSTPIHAYGAGWVRAFLDAELARCDGPALPNAWVELADADGAADGASASNRKPTLASLAERLGIQHPRPGLPSADADVAARVALAWRMRRAASGTEPTSGFEPASEPALGPEPGSATAPLGAPTAPDLSAPRGAPAAPPLLDRRWLDGVPSSPGVYLIEDASGAVLYVGKAVDLRRRLTAYVGRAFGLHRQLDGLAQRAARVRTQTTASDVEARLLEARLLRRHLPPFNVQRRTRQSAALIRVGLHDKRPAARVVPEALSDGARYFGPYRSARVARAQLQLTRQVYPAGVGRTADSADSPDLRRAALQSIARLLSGQKAEALTLLKDRMRSYTAQGDVLGVEEARKVLRAVLALEAYPSPLLGLAPAEPLLVLEGADLDDSRRAHLIRDGVLVASMDADARADLASIAGGLVAVAEAPSHPEDAHVTLRWLMEPSPARTIVPLRRLTLDA